MKFEHKTKTRAQAISLSAYYAEHIKKQMLANDAPYIINIMGDRYAGKSLIIDTMMEYLLDGHDHTKLYKQKPQNKQLLETEPGDAEWQHLSIKGKCEKTPVQLSFDRMRLEKNPTPELMECFKIAAKTKKMPKGVIFTNCPSITSPALEISAHFPPDIKKAINAADYPQNIRIASREWDRYFLINTHDPTLKPFTVS